MNRAELSNANSHTVRGNPEIHALMGCVKLARLRRAGGRGRSTWWVGGAVVGGSGGGVGGGRWEGGGRFGGGMITAQSHPTAPEHRALVAPP